MLDINEIERIALGTVWVYPELMAECPYTILATDFSSVQNRVIFECIQLLRQEGSQVSHLSIYAKAKKIKRQESINEEHLKSLPIYAETNASSLSILKEHSVSMSISSFAMQLYSKRQDGQGMEMLADMRQFIDRIGKGIIESSEGKTLKETVIEITESYEKTTSINNEAPIPTGWKSIDSEIGGGLGGELWVIAARPGQGKTVIGAQISKHVASTGVPVSFVNLEMRQIQLAKRIVTNTTGIDPQAFRSRTVTPSQLSTIKDNLSAFDVPLYLDFSPGINADNLLVKIELKLQMGVRVVLVDYLQRVDFGTTGSTDSAIGKFTGRLKTLALKYNAWIIIFSQVNREVEDSLSGKNGAKKVPKPLMKHLKNSGYIEADADVIWSIVNFGYYKIEFFDNGEIVPPGLTMLYNLKFREKRFKDIPLYWNQQFQLLSDIPQNQTTHDIVF